MITADNLKTMLQQKLQSGVKSRHSEYHLMQFSYINCQQQPKIDTVVLRDFNQETLWFHSDFRSHKIAALQNNAEACLHFYSKTDKLQMSCQVETTIHHKNEISQQRWQNSREISKQCYRQAGLPADSFAETQPVNIHAAYENFCVIENRIKCMDVLWLNIKANRRFIINNDEVIEVNP